MKLPRPPWAFRGERDRLQFKAWMNQQLDDATSPDIDLNDPAYVDAVERHFTQQLKRGRVIIAAQQRDGNALARLTANDPHLKDLAIRQLVQVRARGRQKGEARPKDLTSIEKALLDDALRDLDRIREICMGHWNRWKGSEPIAMEIAAERAGLTPDQLINFKKNRVRDLRLKSPT